MTCFLNERIKYIKTVVHVLNSIKETTQKDFSFDFCFLSVVLMQFLHKMKYYINPQNFRWTTSPSVSYGSSNPPPGINPKFGHAYFGVKQIL